MAVISPGPHGNTAATLHPHATQPFRSLYAAREDVNRINIRLDTFSLWPAWAAPDIPTETLALAGLYYTGDADMTRCFSCRRIFANWRAGMDPLAVHRERAPECEYMKALSAPSGDRDETPNEEHGNWSNGELSSGRDAVDAGISHANTNVGGLDVVANNAQRSVANSRDENAPRIDDGNYLEPDRGNFMHLREENNDNNPMLTEDGNIQITRSAAGGSLESDSIGQVEGDATNDVLYDGSDDEGEEEEINNIAATSWTKMPVSKNPAVLKAENAALRRFITCRRCNESQVQTLFLPCRHLVSCEACAEAVENCVQCGAAILGTVRTYIG